jgi:hypothetical protein
MPADPRDFKVELSSVASSRGPATVTAGRPFLSVEFACCSVYQRIYRDPDGRAYTGRCPKCGKPVRFPVGPGGTNCRFFRVY